LAFEHADLDLNHVEPAGVLGGVSVADDMSGLGSARSVR
jgi:hypothetical protein